MAQRHLDDEVLWHGKVFGWKNGICPIKNPLNACQFSTAIFCNICVHYEKALAYLRCLQVPQQ